MTGQKPDDAQPTPTPAPAPPGLDQLVALFAAAAAGRQRLQPRAERPSSAPTMPDATADKDEWVEFKDLYATWVEQASDEELLAEMAWIPEEGRALSPAEAWMYHECELRRRRPASHHSAPVAQRRGKGR